MEGTYPRVSVAASVAAWVVFPAIVCLAQVTDAPIQGTPEHAVSAAPSLPVGTPVDFDFWKGTTVVVAAFAVFVAFQQFRTARAKLKLDLFEKRFSVFRGVRVFLSQIQEKGTLDLADLFSYRAAIGEASFLFRKRVTEYINEIDRRALRLRTMELQIKELPAGPKRSGLAEQISTELGWLTDQLPRLKDEFGPYMKFSKWR